MEIARLPGMRRALAAPAALLLAAAFLQGEDAPANGAQRTAVPLGHPWKIQPATSPDIPPQENDWGTSTSGAWKDLAALSRKKTSWQNADPGKVHSLWFGSDFDYLSDWKGRRIVASFPRIEGDAIVFLNGRRVTELLRPGGDVDLTDAAIPGRNSLRVFLTRDYTGISRGFDQDPLRRAVRNREKIEMSRWGLGITAPAELRVLPDASIRDVFIIPSWRKKELSLEVDLFAGEKKSATAIETSIYDAENRPVFTFTGDAKPLPAGKSTRVVAAKWENPKCWDLDAPYLYTVRVRLLLGDEVRDELPPVRFGFREVWTEGKEIFLNGHPSRWRLSEIYGANAAGLSVYRLAGFNVGQIQPHSMLWWRSQQETPLIDEALLHEMDRTGMGCTVGAPSANGLGEALDAPGGQKDYAREAAHFIRKYRNHPSVLAWVVGMNSYNPHEAIEPAHMGVREEAPKGQAATIKTATGIVKAEDPTRLAFSHADGNIGDIASANVYLNFVPLQEREEWPMAWSQHGQMPFSAVEFGAPFTANFWKGKQFLLTEYLAIYLGDEAYFGEGEAGLAKTVDYGLANKSGFGKWNLVDLSQYPRYRDFQRLFVKNTNRAWRTWGVNAGWGYWLIGERFGHPEKSTYSKDYSELNYNFLKRPLAVRPDWANPNFDIHSEANRPLLVYLAGSPIHTDKTHAFFSGERIDKQIAAVQDGATPCLLRAEWSLFRDGQAALSGNQNLDLAAGAIAFAPISFEAPEEPARTEFTLKLTWETDRGDKGEDAFAIEVFPRQEPLKTAARFALYDPANKSATDLAKIGLRAERFEAGSPLDGIDVLIVGREAIRPGTPLPFSAGDVSRGLRVIILEQLPHAWQSLGFQTAGPMPRYVFARDVASPILSGVRPADLISWRGSPDLLPEGSPPLPTDSPRAPKWTNRHAVASVALRTPHVAGFTPILETEFDLQYSPLLEWRSGRGAIYFVSLDFTGRMGTDPSATLLAKNLLGTAAETLGPTKPVHFVGDKNTAGILAQSGIAPIEEIPDSADAILIIGPGTEDSLLDSARKFAAKGGTALFLPGSPPDADLNYSRKSILRALPEKDEPLLRGIGPGLLRWQEPITADIFGAEGQPEKTTTLAGGTLLERKIGSGREIRLQLIPSMLADKHAGEAERKEATQLSLLRLQRFLSQLLTNLGATPCPELASRITAPTLPPTTITLGSWKVLGPFQLPEERGAAALDPPLPGFRDALQGAGNPNTTYKLADGSVLDWRRTAEANEKGFVDLGEVMGGAKSGNVAFATRGISSDRAKTVTLLLGADYWAQVWVNGTPAIKIDEPHGAPLPNTFRVKVPLKKGPNVITLRVASGTGGFGFWCRLREEETPSGEEDADLFPLYRHPFKPFDPYHFTYW